MARAPYLTLGGVVFVTKAAFVGHVQELLQRKYAVGQYVDDPMDEAVLRHVAALHPQGGAKWAAGIVRFRVLKHGDRGDRKMANARAFYAITGDGQAVPFSYRKCLGIAPKEGGGELRVACRNAVGDRIAAFKERALAVGAACPVSGVRLCRENSHVDHHGEWPFARIADAWLAQTTADLALRDGMGGLSREFASRATAQEFLAFHDERATLRLVEAGVNLRAGAHGYKAERRAG